LAIEWTALAGAILPVIKKFAAERAEKLAGHLGDKKLSEIYRHAFSEDVLARINELFVSRFNEELDRAADLPTLSLESYHEALGIFLVNCSVQDVLQMPLDGQSDLDWQLLAAIWGEMKTAEGASLITLPSDFSWLALARMYRREILRHMVANPALRPIIAAVAHFRIVEASERTASAIERMAGQVRSLDLDRYARSIQQAFGHLRLGSIDADWTHYERSVRLESVYVPQSVKQALPARERTRDYLAPRTGRERPSIYSEATIRSVATVVEDPNNALVVILGDPGLGKSTFLKHLALRWADMRAGPLTLFIELRSASHQAGFAGFFDYLDKGGNQSCCLPQEPLQDYLEHNDSLVLFDGLDEIAEGQRAVTVSAIISFGKTFPRARIVLTTRIQGYFPGSPYPELLRDVGFAQFTLQDFEDREIRRFVAVWHQEAFHDPAERVRYQQRLEAAIEDSPAIRELAANPLLSPA